MQPHQAVERPARRSPHGRRGRVGQRQVREPLHQAPDRLARLQPRQRRAEANVLTAAEADVRRFASADVEPVRVGERGWIAVGRRRHHRRHLVGADRAAAQRLVARGDPLRALDRRLEAQDLLHRRADQPRVGAQPGEFGRVAQQQINPVADQVGGGDVAAQQQVQAVDADLGVAERAGRRLLGEEVGDQIVARTGAPLGDGVVEVFEDGDGRRLGLPPLRLGGLALEDQLGRFGQRPKPRRVAGVDAQHPPHHRDRDLHGVVGDDVEATGRQPVELVPHDDLDLVLHRRDAPHQRRLDRLADPRVVGLVHPADAGVALAGTVHVGRLEGTDHRALLGAVGVLPLGGVGEPRPRIGHPRQQVGAALLIEPDRVLRPQPVEPLMPLIDRLGHPTPPTSIAREASAALT